MNEGPLAESVQLTGCRKILSLPATGLYRQTCPPAPTSNDDPFQFLDMFVRCLLPHSTFLECVDLQNISCFSGQKWPSAIDAINLRQ